MLHQLVNLAKVYLAFSWCSFNEEIWPLVFGNNAILVFCLNMCPYSLILGKILSYYGTKVMNRMLSSYTIYYIVSPWQQICWNISALQYYIRNVCLIIYYLKVTVAPAQLFFKQLLKQLWDDRIVQPTMLPTLVKYCMQSEFVHACNY